MTDSEPVTPDSGAGRDDRQSDPRKTRGIRFSDSEWEEVRKAAEKHGVPAAEFVRERALDIARNDAGTVTGPNPASLSPLIERTFRYAYILATAKRNEMIAEGRRHEIDELGKTARKLQDSLLSGPAE